METIIEILKNAAALIGAAGVIIGAVYAFAKWFIKQDNQSVDISELKKHHDSDMRDVQEELCVVNYAVLAALDALKQQGYNGGVTDARDKLEKHINQKAHRQ